MTAGYAVDPARSIVSTHGRRRPSGEPPPLPRRINTSGKWWLALAVMVVVSLILVATLKTTAVALDSFDHALLRWAASLRTAWLTQLMKVIGVAATGWGLQILWLVNLVLLLIWRRWRHLIVWVGVGIVVDSIAGSIAGTLQRPRPLGVEIISDWHGFAMPSVPMAILAAFSINTLYANVPAGHPRQLGKVIAGILLTAVAMSRIYLAQEGPSDALFGVVIGVALSLVAFRLFASNEVFPVTYTRGRAAHLAIDGARLAAIERALQDQLGMIATEVKPFGLEGSGGSTPLRIKLKGDPDSYVFGKLYAATHLRADRWYKLGRTLLYGRLEDEKPFNTVRRLVQYEDYVLRLLGAAGLPVPEPLGIVELTPEREYLLVMEFFDGAREIGEAAINDEIIDEGVRVIRQMWHAGLAHRDIKPANLLVKDGHLRVIDSAFAQIRPSPWRQAVDLANMMLVLALRSDAQRVYDRTRLQFDDEEIAEAFAATRGLTMPSQLRRMLRAQGHDLHAEFLKLLPYQLPPVRIQRWSLRRMGLTLAVLGVGGVAVAMALQLLTSNPV
jgi:tRNA A-37 threonylcarbamoyl transferase component Bud32/membrane-associated phospholipid phosphatase